MLSVNNADLPYAVSLKLQRILCIESKDTEQNSCAAHLIVASNLLEVTFLDAANAAFMCEDCQEYNCIWVKH